MTQLRMRLEKYLRASGAVAPQGSRSGVAISATAGEKGIAAAAAAVGLGGGLRRVLRREDVPAEAGPLPLVAALVADTCRRRAQGEGTIHRSGRGRVQLFFIITSVAISHGEEGIATLGTVIHCCEIMWDWINDL